MSGLHPFLVARRTATGLYSTFYSGCAKVYRLGGFYRIILVWKLSHGSIRSSSEAVFYDVAEEAISSSLYLTAVRTCRFPHSRLARNVFATFPAGIPTEVLVRIMSYAFGPYREGRVVEQCWATDGPDCRGVQAKTLLPVGSIVKLQRSVLCDIGFLRALCLYDDENGIEQTGWITVETKNNFKVYIKQILSVPLSKFVRAQTNPFPKIHRAREFNGGNSTTGRKKRKAGKQGGELSSSDTTTGRKKCKGAELISGNSTTGRIKRNAGDLSSGIASSQQRHLRHLQSEPT